jgi:hypothetical protein
MYKSQQALTYLYRRIGLRFVARGESGGGLNLYVTLIDTSKGWFR